MTSPTSIQLDQLPATIRGYLAAHDAGDADTALRAFTPTAVVVDDGVTYRVNSAPALARKRRSSSVPR